MAAGPAMALVSRTSGVVCTRPTRGAHGAAAEVAVAARAVGPPGGSGASVGIRIIGALEGGNHPRVVLYENACYRRCRNVGAGIRIGVRCSFFLFPLLYCFCYF